MTEAQRKVVEAAKEWRAHGWCGVEGCHKYHYFEDGYVICHSLRPFAEYLVDPVNDPLPEARCRHCVRKLIDAAIAEYEKKKEQNEN